MRIVRETTATDGTKKFLIELTDGKRIESVLIKHQRTLCACLSSQVGCAMKCSFCATGQMGFVRNMTFEEIIRQFDLMQEQSEQEITNVVFMGMGEPLHNYDAVVRAVNELRKRGMSWRKITVSTVGIPDKIKQLGQDTQCTLALSLHAPTDSLRKQLVPLGNKYSIQELLDACKTHPVKPNAPVMIEYILIKDVNDSIACAKELAHVLRSLPHVVINLIPYNSVPEIEYEKPRDEQITAFKQTLVDAGYKTIIRTTKGIEDGAACGMLATATLK